MMSEPTIDEMIAWVEHQAWVDHSDMLEAICSILKEQRDLMALGYVFHSTGAVIIPKEPSMQIIRSFVERVMVRLSGKYGSMSDPRLGELLMGAIRDEVDAMEKELK